MHTDPVKSVEDLTLQCFLAMQGNVKVKESLCSAGLPDDPQQMIWFVKGLKVAHDFLTAPKKEALR